MISQEKIMQLRWSALKDHELTDSAKVLFVALLDLCLAPHFYIEPGKASITVKQLEESLGMSERTIGSCRKQLFKKNYVRPERYELPSGYAVNCYVIIGLENGGEK